MKQRCDGQAGMPASLPTKAHHSLILTCLERDSAFQRRWLASSPRPNAVRMRRCWHALARLDTVLSSLSSPLLSTKAASRAIGHTRLLARHKGERVNERCAAAAIDYEDPTGLADGSDATRRDMRICPSHGCSRHQDRYTRRSTAMQYSPAHASLTRILAWQATFGRSG